MYVCMYVRTYVYMYVCIYVCMCIYIYIYIYVQYLTYGVIHESPYIRYGICARRLLDRQFTGHWIGRHGTIEWPRKSPDFTHLIFS